MPYPNDEVPDEIRNLPALKGRVVKSWEWEQDVETLGFGPGSGGNGIIVEKQPGIFEYLTITLENDDWVKFEKDTRTGEIRLEDYGWHEDNIHP